MATDFTDYAEFLEITAPDVVAKFDEGYEDPEYGLGLCMRCGSLVADTPVHNAYHRALSLTLYVFGASMQDLTRLVAGEEPTESPEEKRTEIESNHFVCKNCDFKDTIADRRKWYKCCPTHTPQNSNDVMCEKCATEFHAIQMPEELQSPEA